MALVAADMRRTLQALLPPGVALTREVGSRLNALLGGMGARLLAAQASFEALLAEADPRVASQMLPDWERLLGLPDDCNLYVPLSLEERRLVAGQRLVEQGGQSRAYFLGLATQLGEPGCTIDEFRPMRCNDDCNDSLFSEADRFVWRVNVPHPATAVQVMTCIDDCNDALQRYTPSLIECPITERKPAHTQVIFAYAP